MSKWIFVLVLAGSLSLSCSQDNGSNGPANSNKQNHFYFSVNGQSWNGETNINSETDPENVSETVLVHPGTGGDPDIVVLVYIDYVHQITVTLYTPAQKGLLLMTDEDPFTMGIINLQNGVNLYSAEVSMDITEFEKGDPSPQGYFVKFMTANFEGTMPYKNENNVEEVHTIKGNLYYNGTY